MEPISLEGRAAIVTGAGRGLGRAYAEALAERGARVVVNDVSTAEDGAAAVAAGIADRGGHAIVNHDTVATSEGGEGIVRAALEAFGRLDIVVSNAGILRDRTFAKMTLAEFDAVLDVHLRGAFNVSQSAFRVMKEQNYGRFVFASSAAGLFGNFGQANYAAAKMGIVGLSNVIAIEGERSGIRANVVAPVAGTAMTEGLLGKLTGQLTVGQVAPLVVYLASEQCAVTHSVLSAAGGRMAAAFVGLTQGWYAGPDTLATPEAVADNLPAIVNRDGFTEPMDVSGEFRELARLFRGAQAGRA